MGLFRPRAPLYFSEYDEEPEQTPLGVLCLGQPVLPRPRLRPSDELFKEGTNHVNRSPEALDAACRISGDCDVVFIRRQCGPTARTRQYQPRSRVEFLRRSSIK